MAVFISRQPFLFFQPYAFFFVNVFMTSKVPTVRTTPIASDIQGFWINDASMKHTNDIQATVIEYGICVDT